MANAVLIPISHLTQPGTENGSSNSNNGKINERIRGKEERLKAIISNLDVHRQTVRFVSQNHPSPSIHSISKLKKKKKINTFNNSTNILNQPISLPPTNTPQPPPPANISATLAAMTTKPPAYSDTQLSAYLRSFQISAASHLSTADLRTAPSAVALAIERINRLDAYDAHAAKAREGYEKTLKRYQSGNYAAERRAVSAGAGAEQQRFEVPPIVVEENRRMSAPVANMGFTPVQQQQQRGGMGAPPNIDASRDPRRRPTGN